MKFYSEELKKFFDTEEQCLAEEEKARVEAEEKKVTKAKLAKAVEDAEKELDKAYAALKTAEEKVEELQKEYDDKVDAIMTPAHDKIKECAKARAEAIKQFNDNFGAYTTTYSGNKALNEFVKIDDMINQFWKRFYC
jgi:chromosome segregation ATPase